jgi:hypothetical protein
MNTINTGVGSVNADAMVPDASEDETSTYEKGSWQEALAQSSTLLDRSTKARKRASSLLWTGAVTGIEEWLPGSDTDVSGENLYNEVLAILGKARKGDASKIKTVAVAVKDHGLVLSVHPNLSKAYAEAVRLTKTQAANAAEDNAAEKAIEALSVPNSTTTVEGAAAILLSKGVDGAVVAILDALGATNEAAHRAFMRAVSTEIAARVQAAKPKPAPKAPAKAKGKAQVATGSSPKAAVKTAGTKAKPGKGKGTKAKPVAVSKSKGDPNNRVLPPRAKPATVADKGEPVHEPVHAGDAAAAQDGSVAPPEVPVKKAVTKAKPVVVRR